MDNNPLKQFRQFFTLALLPLDYLMVLASFVLAYRLKLEFPITEIIYIQPFAEYLQAGAYFALIWVFVFFWFGLYRFRGFHNGWELFYKVAGASTMAIAVFIIGLFLTKTYFFSRLTIIYLWPLTIFMVIGGRAILDIAKNWLQNYGLGVERVVIIGRDKIAIQLAEYYSKLKPNFRVVENLSEINFEILSSTSNVSRIVVGFEPETGQMIKLIRWCEDRGITLQYLPGLVGIYANRLMVESIDGFPIIELSPTPLAGWGRIVKRIFDITLTVIGLIIASPIILLVAIAVKFSSKGPVIYSQKRVGELGRTFTFYKFRSMYAELSTGEEFGGSDAEKLLDQLRNESNEADGPMFKMTNDPRVTPVGRFIRKTSLDEIPQLFNVLQGNMSLVGPRPALLHEVEQYNDNAKRRLLVKPGVTGMWQVSGRNDVSFDEYVRLDTYYIEHWSLWLDIKIILQTIRAVLMRTGK